MISLDEQIFYMERELDFMKKYDDSETFSNGQKIVTYTDSIPIIEGILKALKALNVLKEEDNDMYYNLLNYGE